MNELYKLWVETRQNIYDSEENAYGRNISIEAGQAECRFCKQTKLIMRIDTSDGEYLSFDSCKPCFDNLWNKFKPTEVTNDAT